MNLQSIREYVWGFLDLDSEDMPTVLVDRWVVEAMTRITRLTKRWPFYEQDADLALLADTDEYPIEDGWREITAIDGPDGPMEWIEQTEAERRHTLTDGTTETGRPRSWSVWRNSIWIWPVPDQDYDVLVRGYRKPDPINTTDAGTSMDLPNDFHEVVLSWVMHKAYLHQDDPELATITKAEFDEGLSLLADDENSAPSAQPFTLGGNSPWKRRTLPPHQRWPWE